MHHGICGYENHAAGCCAGGIPIEVGKLLTGKFVATVSVSLTGISNNEGFAYELVRLLKSFSLSLPKNYPVMKLWILGLLCVSLFACSPSEEELLKAGMEKMNTQAWPEAVTYFDQLLEKNPSNAQALNAKGVALFQQGKIKEAIPVFNAAITADSTSYKAWFNRGNAKMELESYKEALADFNIATALDASQTDIFFNRGTALLNMEEYEDALLDFQTVLQANPNQAEAHFRKAKAELGMNDPIHGMESLTNTVNLDPKNAEAYYLLGVTRMSALGQKNEGCADLKMALSLGYAEAETWIKDFCE